MENVYSCAIIDLITRSLKYPKALRRKTAPLIGLPHFSDSFMLSPD